MFFNKKPVLSFWFPQLFFEIKSKSGELGFSTWEKGVF